MGTVLSIAYIFMSSILGLFMDCRGFLRPAPSEKATDQSQILDLGSQSMVFYNMTCAQIWFQKSLHPNGRGCHCEFWSKS